MEFLRYPQLIPDLFNGHVVRPSTKFYSRFSLSMGRSPGFGSIACDSTALLRLGFPPAPCLTALNLATYNNSPDRSTKSTPSHFNALRLLVNIGFQVLFHSPPGVLFTFPSRYSSSIGHQVVFSLGRWSSLLPTGFLVPRGTPDTGMSLHLSHTGLLPSTAAAFHLLILLGNSITSTGPLPPALSPKALMRPSTKCRIWAPPRSLATTYGITLVFFSCGYLDVSVPRVSPVNTILFMLTYPATCAGWVPPFGNLRVYGYLRLTVAYRSLSRPSSAPGAKASTLCSY